LKQFKVKKNTEQLDLKTIELEKAGEYFNFIYDEKDIVNDKSKFDFTKKLLTININFKS